MREVVLCDGDVRIAIQPNHRDAVLSIAKDAEVTFPVTKSNLGAILEGETMQFSHQGIFCKLTRISDHIRVVFAWKGVHNSATCPVDLVESLYESLGTETPLERAL